MAVVGLGGFGGGEEEQGGGLLIFCALVMLKSPLVGGGAGQRADSPQGQDRIKASEVILVITKFLMADGAIVDGLEGVRMLLELQVEAFELSSSCLLYTSPSPRDRG